jgi:hypothetical protein
VEVIGSDQAPATSSRPNLRRIALAIAAIGGLVTTVAIWGRPGPPSTPSPSPSPSPQVIGWEDPPEAAEGIRVTLAPQHAAAPPCGSASLASLPPSQSYLGGSKHWIQETLLINRSEETCSVSGTPQLVAVGSGGVTTLPASTGSDVTRTLARDEGTRIWVTFTPRLACDSADAVVNIAIQWPDGGRTPVTDRLLAPACFDIAVSSWQPAFLAGTIRGFNARIVAPATVEANESFVYLVELENLSDTPGRLDPCPTFMQTFAIPERRQLPCPISVVAPGQTLIYEMKIAAPPARPRNDGQPGSQVLRWELNDRLGETIAFATADITVVG